MVAILNFVKGRSQFMLAIGILLLVACGKNDGKPTGINEESFLICKINGKERKFNFAVNANSQPADWNKIHFVVIAGWETNDIDKSPSFDISLVLPDGAKETTYSVNGNTSLELDGQYCVQRWDAGAHVDTDCHMGGRSDGTYFTLTITSLSRWGVKGKFSGLLRNGSSFLKVTDGEFAAPYN